MNNYNSRAPGGFRPAHVDDADETGSHRTNSPSLPPSPRPGVRATNPGQGQGRGMRERLMNRIVPGYSDFRNFQNQQANPAHHAAQGGYGNTSSPYPPFNAAPQPQAPSTLTSMFLPGLAGFLNFQSQLFSEVPRLMQSYQHTFGGPYSQPPHHANPMMGALAGFHQFQNDLMQGLNAHHGQTGTNHFGQSNQFNPLNPQYPAGMTGNGYPGPFTAPPSGPPPVQAQQRNPFYQGNYAQPQYGYMQPPSTMGANPFNQSNPMNPQMHAGMAAGIYPETSAAPPQGPPPAQRQPPYQQQYTHENYAQAYERPVRPPSVMENNRQRFNHSPGYERPSSRPENAAQHVRWQEPEQQNMYEEDPYGFGIEHNPFGPETIRRNRQSGASTPDSVSTNGEDHFDAHMENYGAENSGDRISRPVSPPQQYGVGGGSGAAAFATRLRQETPSPNRFFPAPISTVTPQPRSLIPSGNLADLMGMEISAPHIPFASKPRVTSDTQETSDQLKEGGKS